MGKKKVIGLQNLDEYLQSRRPNEALQLFISQGVGLEIQYLSYRHFQSLLKNQFD